MTRRWLVPEVVQTSAMDCGPAALRSLLAGHGVDVSYGRLREACQTDVDGTSIDALEEVSVQLGLAAEQVLVPRDHVLRSVGACLPAIAVTSLPNGLTHFIVIWRRVGRWVQIMDPAVGRRWVDAAALEATLYQHAMNVPADAWRAWASSAEARVTFAERLGELGVSRAATARWLDWAEADPGSRRYAALDASARFLAQMIVAGAIGRGAEASRALDGLLGDDGGQAERTLAAGWWSARPAPPDGDEELVRARGAVLIHVKGLAPAEERLAARAALPPDLALALSEPPTHPWRALTRALAEDGWLSPAGLAVTVVAAGLATTLEGLLFRGLMDADRLLTTAEHIWGGWLVAVAFVVALGLLEWGAETRGRALGRRLESRLRAAFFAKIPRLGDRYFQSRPLSDMAERGHAIHVVREVPPLGSQILRSAAGLTATVIGLIWLDPHAAPIVIPGALLALAIPIIAHPALAERDLRRRTHAGGLFRLTLDTLLGLVAVRTHTAEDTMRREHEGLLGEWSRAGESTQRVAVAVEVAQAVLGVVLAVTLVVGHLAREGATGTSLLLTWWALEVPLFAQQLALGARQYPMLRNAMLRLLEPLGAPVPDEGPDEGPDVAPPPERGPLAVRFSGVSAVAGGHTLLAGIDIDLPAGAHVAVVGPSGAGKSSLVGLLLGWHRPHTGEIRVGGRRLGGESSLGWLRSRTAWVDPEVHLWNQSLLDNVLYGTGGADRDAALEALPAALTGAELKSVLETLPEGLQTSLGEGGSFLSGGQGQRVRLARGALRPNVGLVILDEALRGLDRDQRHRLLAQAREHWRDATLICITHDVAETLAFPRAIVIDGGRVVEDGPPSELAARPGVFSRLLAAEHETRTRLWQSAVWRRIRVEDGHVVELDPAGPGAPTGEAP